MIKPTLIAIIFSSTALTACAKPASDSNQKTQASIAQKNLSAEQQKQLQQILEKTKKNLILVKGGTFMMGDFGPEHSIDKLPYDGKGDSSPLHKVTLDDFYLSATKTTYAPILIFILISLDKSLLVFLMNFQSNIVFLQLPQELTGNKAETIANGSVNSLI